MAINIYKYAVSKKLRFPYKGMISVEDLYDLSMEQLNLIYQHLKKQEKSSMEESLLVHKTAEDKDRSVAIAIVVDIFNDKKAATEARKREVEVRNERQKLAALIADKQDETLKGKTIEELQAMLDATYADSDSEEGLS